MGYLVLALVLGFLAWAGNWFYTCQHLRDKDEIAARIDEREQLIATLDIAATAADARGDREAAHSLRVRRDQKTELLRRLEKRRKQLRTKTVSTVKA